MIIRPVDYRLRRRVASLKCVDMPVIPMRYRYAAFRAALGTWALMLLSACQNLPLPLEVVTEPLAPAIEARSFALTDQQDVVGELAVFKTRRGDTLPDIARHFGLGYQQIEAANPGIDVWLPAPGSLVTLPVRFVLPDAPREGLVLNLAAMRLFHFSGDQTVGTYSIGIGRQGWSTPTGHMRVIEKKENPEWRVPASIRAEYARKGTPLPAVVPPGPNNPLGTHALRLSRPQYLIHGTNKPYGVGMRISHGCVRLYPEDIQTLYPQVSVGVDVNIVDQPHLIGWHRGMLYLEAHPSLQLGDAALEGHVQRLVTKLKRVARDRAVDIDWDRVQSIVSRARGIPEAVLSGAPGLDTELAAAVRATRPRRLFGSPETPPLTRDGWYVQAASFKNISSARRLSAVLNHQGPPIPARWLNSRDSFYRVVAGPFPEEQIARDTAQRIKREFELDPLILPPGELRL